MTSTFYDNLEREREFLERLGRAVTEWRLIEGVAYDLYSLFMRGANPNLVSVRRHIGSTS